MNTTTAAERAAIVRSSVVACTVATALRAVLTELRGQSSVLRAESARLRHDALLVRCRRRL